jgi:CO/xanthine dehydrogenase Mo-binding subunit
VQNSLTSLDESADALNSPAESVVGMAMKRTGLHSHVQGHEITCTQVISDRLGIPIENVSMLHGRENMSPYAT